MFYFIMYMQGTIIYLILSYPSILHPSIHLLVEQSCIIQLQEAKTTIISFSLWRIRENLCLLRTFFCCGKTTTPRFVMAASALPLLICIKLSSQINAYGHSAHCSQCAWHPLLQAYIENEWPLAAFDAHGAFGVSPQLLFKSGLWRLKLSCRWHRQTAWVEMRRTSLQCCNFLCHFFGLVVILWNKLDLKESNNKQNKIRARAKTGMGRWSIVASWGVLVTS